MKQTKKWIALLMCAIMMIGCLTGCGGKSDAMILASSVKNINSAKSFDMAVKMDCNIKMSMDGESQDIDMGMEVKGTQFTDPIKAKMMSTVTSAGTSITTESYIQKEGEKHVVYTKAGNQWMKTSIDQLDEAMAPSMNAVKEQLVEDENQYTKKDDIEENGKKYLTYEYTVSGDAIKGMADSMMSSMGSSLMGSGSTADLIKDMVKDIDGITMTILIDRETEMIYQIRCPMAELMNKLLNALIKGLASLSDESDKVSDEMKIETTGMETVITYSNINSAADFEIPKEALEAKEVDLSDVEDLDDLNDLDDED